MVEELMRNLLEAGVHFGHQTRRWNPKMKKYIFGQRSGIYIIDLEKTVECLNKAGDFIKNITSKGGKILFIGTKKQAKFIIKEETEKIGMYNVTNRWLGGLLTNFETIKKSIRRLEKIEAMKEDGTFDNLKKKEVASLVNEKEKLLRDLGGIREMKKLPDAIFIIDPKKEDIAIKEATKLGIPIIALVDTNCNPEIVDYPIPGNDDALKSIRFITSLITKSAQEGVEDFINVEQRVAEEKDKDNKEKTSEDESSSESKDEEAASPSEK